MISPLVQYRTATSVERWSLVNALALLAAAAGALWMGAVWPLLIGGGSSITAFVFVARSRWAPGGHFGIANAVTALRGGILLGLPFAANQGSFWLILMSCVVLGADGLDGWLARKWDLSSEFGAFFDKETDSFFLLLLCGLAAFEGRLPSWILGVGLLRYGFVVLLFCVPTPQQSEGRSEAARYAYGGMVGALLTAFLPYPSVYGPVVLLASGGLVLSFAMSVWRIVPKQHVLRES